MKRLTGNGIATGLAYYERLRDVENILGDEYDLDLLQKQIQAYREGRCSGNCETLNCGDCGILDKIVDRLAAYEDTGLEPCDYSAMAHALKQAERAREDLTEMIRQIGATGLDRLRELAEADREGRCVVLPRLEPGQGDPPGEPGPPGLCPNCNGWRGLVWDKTTGGSRCTICGWTNAKT